MSKDYITQRPFIWATKAKRQMIKCFSYLTRSGHRPTVFCTCATLTRLQKRVTGNVPVQKSKDLLKRLKFMQTETALSLLLSFFLNGKVKNAVICVVICFTLIMATLSSALAFIQNCRLPFFGYPSIYYC